MILDKFYFTGYRSYGRFVLAMITILLDENADLDGSNDTIREAAKKVIFLVDSPLRQISPPPSA